MDGSMSFLLLKESGFPFIFGKNSLVVVCIVPTGKWVAGIYLSVQQMGRTLDLQQGRLPSSATAFLVSGTLEETVLMMGL